MSRRIIDEHLPVQLQEATIVPPSQVDFAKGEALEGSDFAGKPVTSYSTQSEAAEFAGTPVQTDEEQAAFGGIYMDTDEAVEKLSQWLEEALTPQIGKWLVARADPKQSAFETLKWLQTQGVNPPELFQAYSLNRLLEMRKKKIPIYPMADKWLTAYWHAVEQLAGKKS